MKRIITTLILGVLVVVGLISIIRLQDTQSPTTQVTLGGLFNLTGYAAFAGEASRDGFLMAIEDAHIPEGLLKTVIEDAQSDLKTAVLGATKLVDIDKATVVIGPEWTEFGEVVAPVAVKNKVPFISPWVSAEAAFVKPPYYWSATPNDRSRGAALAKYFFEHNLKRIAIVYSNNAWSQLNIKIFKEEIIKKGGFEFISEDMLDQNTTDFRTVLAKIKNNRPDVVYVAIGTDEGHGAFVSQFNQAKVGAVIATDPSRATSAVMKDRYASLMQFQIFAGDVLPKRYDEFEKKYEKRFAKKPGAPSAAAAYDMTSLVLKVISSGATTSEAIVAYMSTMPQYEGYSGPISFDAEGRVPVLQVVVQKYNSQGVVEELK